MLKDNFGRSVTHARISVTDRCNYKCFFCHREGFDNVSSELTPEDWDFFVSVASELGIKYYKITGGEPLLYDGIDEVVKSVRKYGGVASITTNGYFLEEYAESLAEAGVDHVNVSLHSLREDVYRSLTGGGSLKKVLSGIRKALSLGIKLKINFLVLKSNLEEVPLVVSLASSLGVDVNLIELIPLGLDEATYEQLHADLSAVVDSLRSLSVERAVDTFQNREVYILPSGSKVYTIRGYGNPLMCSGCTRVRIGPDGKLKLCLYRSDIYIDLGPSIRSRDGGAVRDGLIKAAKLREPYFKVATDPLELPRSLLRDKRL